MLFQLESTLLFILWLVLATVLLWLIIFIAVIIVQSKQKASAKKFHALLLAFLIAFLLPIILGALGTVLSAIGNVLVLLRFGTGGDAGALLALVPIIGFLIVLILTKYLIDIPWDNATWVSLLTLFILYILLTILPELNLFIGLNL
jgi:hypothetical protein